MQRKIRHILLGPIGLRVLLALYCFFMLTFTRFVSITRNGSYNLIKERYVILLCWLVLVEALNQVTFWLGKKNHAKAAAIKAAVFWTIFSCVVCVYLHYLFTLNWDLVYSWHEEILRVLLYLVLSVIMS